MDLSKNGFSFSKQQNKKSLWEVFSSQVHNLFFSFGVGFALIFVLFFIGAYHGGIPLVIDSSSFHLYSLVYGVFTQFFIGFLFTVFPKYLNTPNIDRKNYLRLFFIFEISVFLFLIFAFISKYLLLIPMLGILTAQIISFNTLYSVKNSSAYLIKTEPNWILVGYGAGIFGNILFIIYFVMNNFLQTSFDLTLLKEFVINISINLFLVFTAFSVAWRMIPAFTRNTKADYVDKRSKNFLNIFYPLFVLKTLFSSLAIPLLALICDLSLFILISYEFYKWKIPFQVPPMMWILYVALMWIPVAFFFGFVENLLMLLNDTTYNLIERASIHIFTVGFITTVLIGFGSRVALGHSGQQIIADKLTVAIFYFTPIVVISRIIASISFIGSGKIYMILVSISALLWLIMFVLWAYRYLGILVRGK